MLTTAKVFLFLVFSQICMDTPIETEYDTTPENGWSLKTTLKKRTFQMFEPIEIATTFRFVGEQYHFITSAHNEELYCAAFYSGNEVIPTNAGKIRIGPRFGSVRTSGISRGYTERSFVRLDSVLDMSLPGTYEIWTRRRAFSYPIQSRLTDRTTFMAYLTSPRYIIQVLPMPVVPVEPPRLRPELNLPEPTAEEREKKWQIVAIPHRERYDRHEAIRIRVVTRYLGEPPITLRRAIHSVPSLGGILVFDYKGDAPRLTRYATAKGVTNGSEHYAHDRWCQGFTTVEEIIPNLFFDMTSDVYYRIWVARHLYDSPVRDNLCSSNTLQIYVDSRYSTWYLRDMPPLDRGISGQ